MAEISSDKDLNNTSEITKIYRELELSEKQIETGKTEDAREVLKKLKQKMKNKKNVVT